MKVAHRKNINKRREKFGYESNSLIGLTMSAVEVLEAEAEEEAEAYQISNNKKLARKANKDFFCYHFK